MHHVHPDVQAVELRDGGKAFMGKGVTKAVGNVNSAIAKAVVGQNPTEQVSPILRLVPPHACGPDVELADMKIDQD